MNVSLEDTTKALKKALDKLEFPDRPSVPPPALPPAEVTPERVEAIATVLLKSNAIVSLFHLNGVTIGELADFVRRAKR